MKITVLTEDTSARGLPAEHGLSLYIETARHTVLFDSGQSSLFARNAAALGVDLGRVDIAVLSHGHYDHGGGFAEFLRINRRAKLYMNRRAFEPHYNGARYIGLDEKLRANGRVVFTNDIAELDSGMTLYTCNGREREFDFGSFGLMMEKDGALVPDDFLHEHYLLIEEDGRRVLISGCSHKGILNIAGWFSPDVLVGGFHLMKMPLGGALRDCALRLAAYPTEYYTCHCTGVEQYGFMKPYMPRLSYISAGDVIEI